MGRTVIVEDGIEEYGTLLAGRKEQVVGLIFGQEISAQKSCVIHLARSPELVDEAGEAGTEQQDQKTKSPSSPKKVAGPTEGFDEVRVLDHVRQVGSRDYRHF